MEATNDVAFRHQRRETGEVLANRREKRESVDDGKEPDLQEDLSLRDRRGKRRV